jgi:hypothetical protein
VKTIHTNTLLSNKLYIKGWVIIERKCWENEEWDCTEKITLTLNKTTVTTARHIHEILPTIEETQHEQEQTEEQIEYNNNTIDMTTNPFTEIMTEEIFETITPTEKFMTDLVTDDDFWDLGNFLETEELQKYINNNDIQVFDDYIG